MVLVATVAIYVSFGILLWSGISHAVFQKAFVASLSSQRIWRQGTEPFIGVIVSILELTVGLGGFIGLAFSFEVDAFLFGAALLYLSFSMVAVYLARNRPDAPCGCSSRNDLVNGWVVIRGLALCGLSLAALLSGHQPPFSSTGTSIAVTVLASWTFGTLLWNLPAAMHNPIRSSNEVFS